MLLQDLRDALYSWALRRKILSYFPNQEPSSSAISACGLAFDPIIPPDIIQLYNDLNINCIDNAVLRKLALELQINTSNPLPNYYHAHILYCLTRHVAAGKHANSTTINYFETGTARGFSLVVAALAASHERSILNGVSMDIVGHERLQFWNCLSDKSGRKTRSQLLEKYKDLLANCIFLEGLSSHLLRALHIQTIDIAFIDGGHTYSDVLRELNYVMKRQGPNSIIIVDDVLSLKFKSIQFALDDFFLNGLYSVKYVKCSAERTLAILFRM